MLFSEWLLARID